MVRGRMAIALLAAMLTSLSAGAAEHRPIKTPKPALDGRCGTAHALQSAYVAGTGPVCCAGSVGCAEFLSTTTIVRPKAPIRS